MIYKGHNIENEQLRNIIYMASLVSSEIEAVSDISVLIKNDVNEYSLHVDNGNEVKTIKFSKHKLIEIVDSNNGWYVVFKDLNTMMYVVIDEHGEIIIKDYDKLKHMYKDYFATRAENRKTIHDFMMGIRNTEESTNREFGAIEIYESTEDSDVPGDIRVLAYRILAVDIYDKALRLIDTIGITVDYKEIAVTDNNLTIQVVENGKYKYKYYTHKFKDTKFRELSEAEYKELMDSSKNKYKLIKSM